MRIRRVLQRKLMVTMIFLHLIMHLGDSDVASIIINESEDEAEEAKKTLEDVRVTFPQVC